MNENEPNQDLQKEQKTSGMPLLTPESMASSAVPSWQKQKSVEDTPGVYSEKPESGAKTVVWISVATVLLAGVILAVVLAANGSLFKGKKKLSQEAEAENAAVETTKKKADPSVSDPTPTPATNSKLSHDYITSLSQINKATYDKMHSAAMETLNITDLSGIGIPKGQVTIDEMNFLGSYRREETDFGGSKVTEEIVENIYQIQVTDNTGAEPVKRQFFTAFGFEGVRQDGEWNRNSVYLTASYVCFDNWCTHGCLDLDRLLARISDAWPPVVGGNVDKSKLLPFDGKDPADFEEHPHVKELKDLPEKVIELYKTEANGWLSYCMSDIANLEGKRQIENTEYVGMALTASPNEEKNLIYIVYKWTVLDMGQDPPEREDVYWYVSFEDCISGFEVYSGSTSQNMDPMSPREWVNYGMHDLTSLRKHLSGLRYGWTYEDNFIEDSLVRGFVFENSDTALIPDGDVKALSAEKVEAAINEILARHGYIFKDEETLSYYKQFDWYEEKVSAEEWEKKGNEAFLNQIELENLEKLMKQKEKREG